jgi:hypothetical protein
MTSDPEARKPKKPKFVKPTAEDMRDSLVRLDRVEVWAGRAYAAEALPGVAKYVQQGVAALFRDRRVVVMDMRALTAKHRKARGWWGHVEDLGPPLPPPRGFRAAKVLRFQRVAGRSLILNVDGKRRIVCFTGLPVHRDLDKLLAAGRFALENVPTVGVVFQMADIGAGRARGAIHGEEAIAAAETWRAVLEGTVNPEDLPLLSETPEPAHHSHRPHRHSKPVASDG